MSKLIPIALLATFIMSNDGEDKYSSYSYKDLVLKYREAQREKEEETPGEVEVEAKQWVYPNRRVDDWTPRIVEELRDPNDPHRALKRRTLRRVSNAYIECLHYGKDREREKNSEDAFDFPMPTGWLYYAFTDDANTMHKFFDTRVNEKHWVLPNVYCNEHGVLAAVSWMISPRSLSDNNNKGMHKRFKDVIPPPFDPNNDRGYRNRKSLEDPHRNGVYCNWDGWLYDSADGHFHHYFDTSNGDESFTFIDVYCHRYTDEDGNAQHTVRYFYKAVGGTLTHPDLIYPFRNRVGNPVAPNEYDRSLPTIECNWTGWLFWDMSDEPWKGKDKKGEEDRWKFSYERYYAIDDRNKGHEKKGWVNGRVMNPFCSTENGYDEGIVTALRVYCFDSEHNRCSDLKPKPEE